MFPCCSGGPSRIGPCRTVSACWGSSRRRRRERVDWSEATRAGIREAMDHLLERVADGKESIALLDILQELGEPSCVPAVLPLIAPSRPLPVQLAALAVLGRFTTPEVTTAVLKHYERMPP